MKNVLFIGVLTIMILSCNSLKKQPLEQTETVPSTWVLTHMNTEKVNFKTTLVLDKTTFSGRAACNRYNGTITTQNETQLIFGNAMSTKMACRNLNQEQTYFSLLKRIDHYEIKNNILILFDAENTNLLVFTKA